MSGKPIRSLEHLDNTASTARVLNLRALSLRHAGKPEYEANPMFKNKTLNKAIILKHRLRPHEHDDFMYRRHTATKILVPIEMQDLRLGARYLFIGQRKFEEMLYAAFGIEADEADHDFKTLAILDECPSLDPFLIREQLRRHGVAPAGCYFEISEADSMRMFEFAKKEIEKLVLMSIGAGQGLEAHAERLASKLLMNAKDTELAPLRKTMMLSEQQYEEGIFCWKAFLYYKWRLTHFLPQLTEVLGQISSIKPVGAISRETKEYLVEAKDTIRNTAFGACRQVKDTLYVYDEAYEALTDQGSPLRFRDFLLEAPTLFRDLGEKLGAIDHIISFWRFRFPNRSSMNVGSEELADIFNDYEQSLAPPADLAA